MQGLIDITGGSFCDLLVYTSNDLFDEQIENYSAFWSINMLPMLYKFYIVCCVPEIIVRRPIEKKLMIKILDQFLKQNSFLLSEFY